MLGRQCYTVTHSSFHVCTTLLRVLCSCDTFITHAYILRVVFVCHTFIISCAYTAGVCLCVRTELRPGARTADRQAAVAFCGERNVHPNRTCVGPGLGLEGGMRGGPG